MALPGLLCNKRYSQCYKCCKTQFNNDFRKVLDLKHSGLVIYIHQKREENALSEKKYDAVVVFNMTEKHFEKSTFLSEIGQHNIKCLQCKTIIQKVRNLLAELKCIKGNETIGVCDYCKRANISNCKRCEYIVNKFMTNNPDAVEAMMHYLKSWVRKAITSLRSNVDTCISKYNLNLRDTFVEELQMLLNELESSSSKCKSDDFNTLVNRALSSLRSIIERFLNKYKINTRGASVEDLYSLLHKLKTPATRQLNIEHFPTVEEIKSLDDLKIMELLEKLLPKYKESEISTKTASTTTTALFKNVKDSTHVIHKTSYDDISFIEKENSILRALKRETKKTRSPDKNKTTDESKVNISFTSKDLYRKDKVKSSITLEKDTITYKSTYKRNKISKFKDKNVHSKSNTAKLKQKKDKDTSEQKNKTAIDSNIQETSNLFAKLLNQKNKEMSKTKKENIKTKDIKGEKQTKEKNDLEELMIKKIMHKERKTKDTTKRQKQEKALPIAKIRSMLDLPTHHKRELVEGSSITSTIECADTRVIPNVMIKKEHIIPLNPHYGKQNGSRSPIQYQVLKSISNTHLRPKNLPKVQHMLNDTTYGKQENGPEDIKENVSCTRNDTKIMTNRRHVIPDDHFPLLFHVHKNISSHSISQQSPPDGVNISPVLPTTPTKYNKALEASDKGVIKYQLSNPEYITKGWTKLPSLRVMRRINIYKMTPVSSVNNWFERNKKSTIMYNESDEVLADIDDLGFGKLYYKNGRVAMDYYKAKEPNVAYRYVIYSDGEPKDGIPRPVTILGVFDSSGYGVVYDYLGCERLKFNQTEGMLIDKTIGSPCKWKWHNLNDPPVLQPVFLDTYSKELGTRKLVERESVYSKTKNVDMLAVELENFLKEKADKLLQKFKPLEVKARIFKLNKQFSLRIYQQSDIYLLFREGRKSIKLNLGLTLISNEILGTEAQDVENLFTTYDQFPPRSESIENIQQILSFARNFKKKNIV